MMPNVYVSNFMSFGFITDLNRRLGATLKAHVQRGASSESVILITIDALRASNLSAYGYSRPTTPAMDALAREGILFERYYANSNWTRPSTASLMTGLLPSEHGGGDRWCPA